MGGFDLERSKYRPARERRPHEVVIGEPVVEHWHQRFPLSVPLIH